MQFLHELNARENKKDTDMIRIKSALSVLKTNFVGDARKCAMG